MKLSVVFPVRNQTDKLVGNLHEKVLPYFDKLGITYEILIVYDGSDETNRLAMEKAMADFPMQVHLLPYEYHLGKGHNVKKGILAATGDYVLFMDADIATELSSMELILPEINQYDAFIASRYLPKSVIVDKQPFSRRMISALSRKMISAHFHFHGLKDTQCGYKLFRTAVAKEVAKRQIIDDFAFDCEYLYFYKLNGFSWKEIPVIWKNDRDSSMLHPLKSSFKFYKDMLRIKLNKKNYCLSKEEKAALMVK
jgi:dolichyl-phosphate beta-glucosyltransferase